MVSLGTEVQSAQEPQVIASARVYPGAEGDIDGSIAEAKKGNEANPMQLTLCCLLRCCQGGAVLLLCFCTLACRHEKVRSMQTTLNTASQVQGGEDANQAATGLDKVFLHDECTGEYPPQPDTCLHDRRHEHPVVFGGKAGAVYDVTLRIRGIFEPTTILGGETPDPTHPYFKVGGLVSTPDWSQWGIEVSEPKQTYWLNHYPSVGHKIYREDFEATIAVAASATVSIRVTDGNDRQIDNGKTGPDRHQVIEGVVDPPLAGQMLRIDVLRCKAK